MKRLWRRFMEKFRFRENELVETSFYLLTRSDHLLTVKFRVLSTFFDGTADVIVISSCKEAIEIGYKKGKMCNEPIRNLRRSHGGSVY